MTTEAGAKVWPFFFVLLAVLSTPISARESESSTVAQIQGKIAADPLDSSAWLRLGDSLMASGKRIPALLAYARFLTFHPESPESAPIARHLLELVFQGVTPGEGSKGVITMSPDSKDPWWPIELLISTVAVNRHSGKAATMSDGEFLATALDGVTLFVCEQLDRKKVGKFWSNQVVDYHCEARAKQYNEPMAHDIIRSLDQPDVKSWLASHEKMINEYRVWSGRWRSGA